MSHMKKSAQCSPLRSNPHDTIDHITDHWMFLEQKNRQSSLVLTDRAFLSPPVLKNIVILQPKILFLAEFPLHCLF